MAQNPTLGTRLAQGREEYTVNESLIGNLSLVEDVSTILNEIDRELGFESGEEAPEEGARTAGSVHQRLEIISKLAGDEAEASEEFEALLKILIGEDGNVLPEFANPPDSIEGEEPPAALVEDFAKYLGKHKILFDQRRTVLAFKSLSKTPAKFADVRKLLESPNNDPTKLLKSILREPVSEFGNYIRILSVPGRRVLPYLTKLSTEWYKDMQPLIRYKTAAQRHPDERVHILYAGEGINELKDRHRKDVGTARRAVEKGESWQTAVEGRSPLILLLSFLAEEALKNDIEAGEVLHEHLCNQWEIVPAAKKRGDAWMMDIQEQLLIWLCGGLNAAVGGKKPYSVLPDAYKGRLQGTRDVRKHFLIAGIGEYRYNETLYDMAFDYVHLALGVPRFELDVKQDYLVFYPQNPPERLQFSMCGGKITPESESAKQLQPPLKQQQADFLSRTKTRRVCIILGIATLKVVIDIIKPHAVALKTSNWVVGDIEVVTFKDNRQILIVYANDPGYDPDYLVRTTHAAHSLALAIQFGMAWQMAQNLP